MFGTNERHPEHNPVGVGTWNPAIPGVGPLRGPTPGSGTESRWDSIGASFPTVARALPRRSSLQKVPGKEFDFRQRERESISFPKRDSFQSPGLRRTPLPRENTPQTPNPNGVASVRATTPSQNSPCLNHSPPSTCILSSRQKTANLGWRTPTFASKHFLSSPVSPINWTVHQSSSAGLRITFIYWRDAVAASRRPTG